MIQRIQSIYLILIIIINVVAGFLFGKIEEIASVVDAFLYEYLIYFVIITLLTFWTLFSYKNRNFQSKVSGLLLILNTVVLGFFIYKLLILPGEIDFSEKGIWVFIPFISIVFIVLALRGIKRDENLVKSADRFR